MNIASLKNKLESLITESGFGNYPNRTVEVIQGGDTNQSFRWNMEGKTYFLKINRNAPKLFFTVESENLRKIKSTNCIHTPEVVLFNDSHSPNYLLLEYIVSKEESQKSWHSLGYQLAQLHQQSNSSFGWERDNYIGTLTQINSLRESWTSFYIENRLIPLVQHGVNSGRIPLEFIPLFDKIYLRLDHFFPKEEPSLLHGDLWRGNVMFTSSDTPVLVDPASYFGHREMDLGMSLLFGGFTSTFYAAYNDQYPLERNWKDRIQMTQIYPLLVHVNLFGNAYLNQLKGSIRPYL